MFKRLLAWLRPKPVDPYPGYKTVHWAVDRYGPVLLGYEDRKDFVISGKVNYNRPDRIVPHGPTKEKAKASGRAWMVDNLPDECTFL
jgi:hypothetical protein